MDSNFTEILLMGLTDGMAEFVQEMFWCFRESIDHMSNGNLVQFPGQE